MAFLMPSVNTARSVEPLASSRTIPQVLATGSLSTSLSTNAISGLCGNPKGGGLAAPVQNPRTFSKLIPVRPAEKYINNIFK